MVLFLPITISLTHDLDVNIGDVILTFYQLQIVSRSEPEKIRDEVKDQLVGQLAIAMFVPAFRETVT